MVDRGADPVVEELPRIGLHELLAVTADGRNAHAYGDGLREDASALVFPAFPIGEFAVVRRGGGRRQAEGGEPSVDAALC